MRNEIPEEEPRTWPKKRFSGTALGCFVVAVLIGVAQDESKAIVKKVAKSTTTFVATVWVWPSDYVTNRRLELIAEYRVRAATELWTARNMTFEEHVPEEFRAALRKRYIGRSVMLELKARKLEEGRLVRRPMSATWYEDENFSIYPRDLVIPLDLEYPRPR